MSTPLGSNAPYKIVKNGDKWEVRNNTGAVKASFDSYAKALAYQRALYVNVPGAPKRAAKVPYTGKARDRVAAQEESLLWYSIADFERIKAAVSAESRRSAKKAGDTMPDGSYPVRNQNEANKAWMLRGKSKNYSAAQIEAHIRRQVKKHNLSMPGQDSSS